VTDTRVLWCLRLAKDAMDRSWAEPLDLAMLATTAGYSRYHFVRLFKETYGETPGRYLTRRRIERARELLRSVNLTVTEICMMVGFTSLGTFCTRFKARKDGPAPIPGCFVLFWAGGFRRADSNFEEGADGSGLLA
jgi:AraC-like DNA-binding protein